MQQRFRVEVVTTAEKSDDCIESSEQLDKFERFDVREDSTVVQQSQEVVQKIVEMHRFSTNGANGSEDRGDYTSAVLDKVVDMSVVVQHQVPMVQMVQKTVGHEESQSACMIATGRVAAYQLTSTAWN